MKKRSSNHSEQSCRLAFEHRLSMYALAASAAGMGMLAQPAEGKIVYTKTAVSIAPDARFPLYLNHGSIPDFVVDSLHYATWAWGTFSIIPYNKSSQVLGTQGSASALHAGVKVGPKGPFLRGKGLMAHFSEFEGNTCWGPWGYASDRYLGLKFSITGRPHFGWARLSVRCPGIEATLTGYAYETIPNRPIVTGKTKGLDVITVHPGSLGALAAGRK